MENKAPNPKQTNKNKEMQILTLAKFIQKHTSIASACRSTRVIECIRIAIVA
jgi:hypothetical protein